MFRVQKERLEILNELKPYLRIHKSRIAVLFMVRIILALLQIMNPFIFKILIDDVIIKGRYSMLKWVIIGYLALYAVETLTGSINLYFSNRLYVRLIFDIRKKLWKKLLGMPLIFHDANSAGDLKNTIDSDVERVEGFLNNQIINYIINWLTFAAYAAVLVYIDWRLAICSFLIVPLSFWLSGICSDVYKKTYKEWRDKFGEYENWLYGSINGWKEIKALGTERSEFKKMTKYWHVLSIQHLIQHIYWVINTTMNGIKDFLLSRVIIYLACGVAMLSNVLTVGSALVFIKYYESFFSVIESINNAVIDFKGLRPFIEKVFRILSLDEEQIRVSPHNKSFSGEMEFSDVSFSYDGSNEEALKNVSFKIKKHDKVAFVGRSGDGKTTVVKLILGLYKPQNGVVMLDGHDMSGLDKQFVSKNIGVVMQNASVFNQTVRENLLFAKPDADKGQIENACRLAQIHDFIINLQDGYDTLIGENGVKLSGGQRQRLAIARVLLTDPDFIIFDEATSSLDSDTEKSIHSIIKDISKSKTVVIIAHRLSSIMLADRVIVIENGRIAGDGSHDDLLESNETYRQLFGTQYKNYMLQVSREMAMLK